MNSIAEDSAYTVREDQNFLITAAGTGTGYGYALALRRTLPDVRLVTVDTNPGHLVSAAALADEHIVAPPFNDESYPNFIESVIRQGHITHYLPVIDPEIRFAAKISAKLACVAVTPDADFCTMALKKSEYPTWLHSLGIATPHLMNRNEAAKSLPCWAKHDGGFGGRLSRRILTESEIETVPSGWFFQEELNGPEYTVDCFPFVDGSVCVSVRERLEVKAGVCVKAKLSENKDFENIATRIASCMQTKSPFCFQAILDVFPRVTDINPRLGAGTALSAANGLDFFSAHIAQVLGASPKQYLQRRHATCFVTRQYAEFLAVAE